MNGIPDPGRASKAVELATGSPFDAGRIPCPQGGEDRGSGQLELMAVVS